MKKAFLLTLKYTDESKSIIVYNSKKKYERAIEVVEDYNSKFKEGYMYTVVYSDGSDELLNYHDGLIRTLDDNNLLGAVVVKSSVYGII